MKELKNKQKRLWMVCMFSWILLLFLFVGCTADVTNVETTGAPDPATTAESSVETTAEPAITTAEPETVLETEAFTEELKGWEQDTGKFNDGIVDYEKLVETEIYAAYPDDQIGQIAPEIFHGVPVGR